MAEAGRRKRKAEDFFELEAEEAGKGEEEDEGSDFDELIDVAWLQGPGPNLVPTLPRKGRKGPKHVPILPSPLVAIWPPRIPVIKTRARAAQPSEGS